MLGAYGGIIWRSKWHIVDVDQAGGGGRYSACGVRLLFTMPFPDEKAQIEPGEEAPREEHQCKTCLKRVGGRNQVSEECPEEKTDTMCTARRSWYGERVALMTPSMPKSTAARDSGYQQRFPGQGARLTPWLITIGVFLYLKDPQ